jgi:hypothetical protein
VVAVSLVSFAIEKTFTVKDDGKVPPVPPKKEEVLVQPNQLTWSGEVTSQKWMQFYSKVLSKFSANKDLKLTLTVNVVVEGEISEQRLEETKVSLQELGLDSDIQSL